MKIKTIMLVAVTILSAACADTDEIFLSNRGSTFIKEFITEIGKDTKTTVSLNGKVDWEKGDVIHYYSLKNGTVRNYTIQEDAHSISFPAEIETSASFLIAVFGGTSITDNTGSTFTLNGTSIKKNQTGIFGDGHIAVVKTYDLNSDGLNFKNISSFIRFSLTRDDIDHIVFKSLDGTSVAGDDKLTFTFSGTDYNVSFKNGIDSLTVNTNGSGDFYISTLPCEMTGFALKCYDADNHYLGEAKKNTVLKLESNGIVNLGVLDDHIVDISVKNLSMNTQRAYLKTGDAFQLSTVVEPYYAKVKTVQWSVDNDNIVSVSSSGLLVAKGEGSCLVRVTVNGKISDTCHVMVKDGNDLSAYGTANCYVVSKRGTYKFRADVKGNGTESLDGVPFKAVVLWESFCTDVSPSVGDVVYDASFSNGYITFTSGSDGNAVIAVKDIDDEILWSWHIWVCEDFVPEKYAQVYYNKAGIMMDRNLGATNTYTGAESYGLFYQWGRKDPFLNTSDYDATWGPDKYIAAASTTEWPTPVTQSISVSESVQNPKLFVSTEWGGWEEKNRNDLWASEKTIFDPCPVGWHVPSTTVWTDAAGSRSGETKWSNSSFQYIFTSEDVKYPESGYISWDYYSSGWAFSFGRGGFCWSYEINPNTSGFRYYALGLRISSKYWYGEGTDSKDVGRTIRCVQE